MIDPLTNLPLIEIDDIPGPTEPLCWAQAPTMERCDRRKGHTGQHVWEYSRELAALSRPWWHLPSCDEIRHAAKIGFIAGVAAGRMNTPEQLWEDSALRHRFDYPRGFAGLPYAEQGFAGVPENQQASTVRAGDPPVPQEPPALRKEHDDKAKTFTRGGTPGDP